MSLFLIASFVCLAATSSVLVIFLLVTAVQSSPNSRIRKRLRAIGGNPFASQREVRILLKTSLYSEIPWFNNLLTRVKLFRGIEILLERANLDMSVGTFLLFSFFSGGVIFSVINVFGQQLSLALLTGAVGLFGPYFYLKYRAVKRLKRFLEQMPDGLDMISQGLQAGLGLTQALVFISKEMPDPMGTEFSVFMEELNLGLPLGDALKGLEARVSLPEVHLLSIALLVQRDVGGSLSELLNKLADVIRDRFRIERQIKTLTAHNRMSAWVISSMPPALTVFMFAMDPVRMNETWSDPLGQMMLTGALILEVIGILVFRKLIRIRI
jgi:tight adherence protein B